MPPAATSEPARQPALAVTITPPPRPQPEPAMRRGEVEPPAVDRPVPVLRPPLRETPPSVFSEPESEPPIEVHIGRVEVRPPRPPEPPPQQAVTARPERGFEDFELARRGLDRRWY
jgi:hypothetical protein